MISRIRFLDGLLLTILLILPTVAQADYTVGDWTIQRLTENDRNDQNPAVSGQNVTWMTSIDWTWEIMAWLDGELVQLTETGHHSYHPQISGSNITWSGDVTGNGEIFLYDGMTTTRLTMDSVDDRLPQISGSRVVWHGYHGQDRDVFMWFDGVITQLSDNTESDDEPQVWGSSVVWAGLSPREIFFYDGLTVHQLTSTGQNDRTPRVYGNVGDDDFSVVWSGYDGDTFEIYRYDGTTTEKLTDSTYGRDGPEIHGSRIACQGWLEDGRQHAFLIDESGTHAVSPDTQMIYYPQVSESIVAWWATTSTDYQGEIYVYEDGIVTRLTDNSWPDNNVRVSGNTVVWEARPDGSDYEIYMATKSTLSSLDPTEVNAVSTAIRATPNPFNPQTTIEFSMVGDGHADISVYDLTGRLVRVLTNDTYTVGDHSIVWNGRDAAGRDVPSGGYIVRLETGSVMESRMISLIR